MATQRRLEFDIIEGIWLELLIKNSKSLLVFVVYRPPNTSKYLSPEFNDTLNDMLSTCLIENKEAIILGDSNCDYLNRLNNKEIKDVLLGHGFKQVITMPTRITRESSTLIDIQGVAKKKEPLQKFLTWFTMTMNEENANKSCVFVLA